MIERVFNFIISIFAGIEIYLSLFIKIRAIKEIDLYDCLGSALIDLQIFVIIMIVLKFPDMSWILASVLITLNVCLSLFVYIVKRKEVKRNE